MTKKEIIPGYDRLIDHLTKQPGIVEMAKQLKKDYPDGIPGSYSQKGKNEKRIRNDRFKKQD